MPLAPRAEAEAYTKANREIDAKVEALRDKISDIEKPYRDRLRGEYIKKNIPRTFSALSSSRKPNGHRESSCSRRRYSRAVEVARRKRLRS